MADYESDDDALTKREAFDQLADEKGQAYLLPDRAHELLYPFSEDATDEFLAEHGMEDYPGLVFPEAIADEQVLARDARGIVSVSAYQPILTVADTSAILVEALGKEPSDYVAGGAGFTADGRHDVNLDTIKSAVYLEATDGD